MESIAHSELGLTGDGRVIDRYALRNRRGISADIMTYGATLMALRTPDRSGKIQNIVLGFDTLEPYLAGTPQIGATVGRYANRIAGARFTLDGHEYRLTANDGRHQLHGGALGFDKVIWAARTFTEGDSASVTLAYVSADGEEGYPGELAAEVTYRLSYDDVLSIDYRATTSKPTHVNLTHHSYFNLGGQIQRDVSEHVLTIDADRFTPVDSALIPTGEVRSIDGTPFDFRSAQPIGARIEGDDEQIRIAGGYDHNFILNKPGPGSLTRAAMLSEPASGRALEVWTTEPGLQFYSGNGLSGDFAPRAGLCLEPQHFPNSPNEPGFPSTVLRPGAKYRSRTEFRFSATP